MAMPGLNSHNTYRYGFNGMEKDDEVKGSGNSYDFGARCYDSRLGRFLSIDREVRAFPFSSPYSFASNSPIRLIDFNGNDPRPPYHEHDAALYITEYVIVVDGERMADDKYFPDAFGNLYRNTKVQYKGDITKSSRVSHKLVVVNISTEHNRMNSEYHTKVYSKASGNLELETSEFAGGGPHKDFHQIDEAAVDESVDSFNGIVGDKSNFYDEESGINVDTEMELSSIDVTITGTKSEIDEATGLIKRKLKETHRGIPIKINTNVSRNSHSISISSEFTKYEVKGEYAEQYNDAEEYVEGDQKAAPFVKSFDDGENPHKNSE